MQVRALVSFAGKAGAVQRGAVFELPDGVDWLQAGLVEPVEVAAAAMGPAPHLASMERATDKRAEAAELRGEQHGLMDISGIGARLAKRLAGYGVSTPADLLAADATALAHKMGLSVETVCTWQVNARMLDA